MQIENSENEDAEDDDGDLAKYGSESDDDAAGDLSKYGEEEDDDDDDLGKYGSDSDTEACKNVCLEVLAPSCAISLLILAQQQCELDSLSKKILLKLCILFYMDHT